MRIFRRQILLPIMLNQQKYWPLVLSSILFFTTSFVAHDGLRIAQVLVLVLPVLVLLQLKPKQQWCQRLYLLLIFLWGGAFIVDAAVRGFLLSTYQALPNSSLVLTALANTQAQESIEFLYMYWPSILSWLLFAGLGVAVYCWCIRSSMSYSDQCNFPYPSALRALQVFLLILFIIALLLKPWRRLHPVVFWPSWLVQLEQIQTHWSEMANNRATLLLNAQKTAPRIIGADPNTVVLIISDSVNRDNLGLYGYSRQTTPQLDQLASSLLVYAHSWSLDSATIPALQRFFQFGNMQSMPEQHLLALASAAGYRIWWVSNHDDVAIEQQHARFAHSLQMLNAQPGRSSRNLDQQVIPFVKQALADPTDKKLIVVHLLGAHPHYRLRYPNGMKTFTADAVDEQLRDQQRSLRLRQLRREYDTAIYYHDQVLADLFALREGEGADQSWLYFSDHGQEVAHSIDHAGHSAQTTAGYRIPVILWQSEAQPTRQAAQPVRSDWLGWTMLNLLRIDSKYYRADRDILQQHYRWQPPELPIQVDFKT